ncbi:unnamed protein product [Acidithrix sp. C25]|nr:unnamed protein product [Acidithrix sp. C25]
MATYKFLVERSSHFARLDAQSLTCYSHALAIGANLINIKSH